MEPFIRHRGVACPLDRANVDTDQIIAKQFLKSIKKTGFGEHLFHDWRHNEDGTPNDVFSLNHPSYRDASVLIARNNFGCGSSREHAVWAVKQYGFRVVIAPWKGEGDERIPAFADIFRSNSVKNGLLTVELHPDHVDEVLSIITDNPGIEITVDLETQEVIVHHEDEKRYVFEIEDGIRDYLMRGLDEIALALEEDEEITAFEARHDDQMPVQA